MTPRTPPSPFIMTDRRRDGGRVGSKAGSADGVLHAGGTAHGHLAPDMALWLPLGIVALVVAKNSIGP